MRVGFLVGVVLLSLACVGVAAANEPPLAEAGLDQDGEVNATVYLDAGGSLDPDGAIDEYEWEIEAPDGTSMSPDCSSCSQTRFVPQGTGRYDVTVRVTDEAGATMEDTLFVRVGNTRSTSTPAPSTPAAAPPGTSPTVGGSSGGSGGGGGGGSGGGSSSAGGNAFVVQTDDDLYLSGGAQQDEYRIPVGDDFISISGEKFRQHQTDGSRAPLEAFGDEMRAAGVTDSDIQNSMDSRSCGTTSGNACTSAIDSASGDDGTGPQYDGQGTTLPAPESNTPGDDRVSGGEWSTPNGLDIPGNIRSGPTGPSPRTSNSGGEAAGDIDPGNPTIYGDVDGPATPSTSGIDPEVDGVVEVDVDTIDIDIRSIDI